MEELRHTPAASGLWNRFAFALPMNSVAVLPGYLGLFAMFGLPGGLVKFAMAHLLGGTAILIVWGLVLDRLRPNRDRILGIQRGVCLTLFCVLSILSIVLWLWERTESGEWAGFLQAIILMGAMAAAVIVDIAYVTIAGLASATHGHFRREQAAIDRDEGLDPTDDTP
jgi:hypothetical protein